jgi:hypothetical protein
VKARLRRAIAEGPESVRQPHSIASPK